MNIDNNGVGPSWFPTILRSVLTKFSLLFFDEKAWVVHDDLYTRGGSEEDRKRADLLFLKDLKSSLRAKNFIKQTIGMVIAYIFYLFVSLLGSFSYYYK